MGLWLLQLAGQQLFYPPNVAGWDDARWLDTATFRARWEIAGYAMRPKVLKESAKHVPGQAEERVRSDRIRRRAQARASSSHDGDPDTGHADA